MLRTPARVLPREGQTEIILHFRKSNLIRKQISLANMLKLKFKDFLRKTQFLTQTDYLLLCVDTVRHYRSNRNFLKQNPGFAAPPKRLSFDAYNHTSLKIYDVEGRIHARLITDSIKKYLQSDIHSDDVTDKVTDDAGNPGTEVTRKPGIQSDRKSITPSTKVPISNLRLAEWGCGPARLIRHLTQIDGIGRIELHGYDYNSATIDWCKKNLEEISFHTCNLEPPLSAGSDYFDCVYALSVFTHLSEKMHYEWMDELFRVLRPGGVLIFTTHGNNSAHRLLPDDRKTYEAGGLVVKGGVSEGKKHFLAYHPPAHIRNKLLKGKKILGHLESPDEYRLGQDVWIVRK